jgi:8-oxo-dGTP pyrophosphatase MutT (NUDIX family)
MMHENTKCNNCGKMGHLYYQCKVPITSVGIIAVRMNVATGAHEYLMIRRKDTLGYIDFMRGKYSIYNRPYIINMLKQMTLQEKEQMRSGDFGLLWQSVWGKPLPAAAAVAPSPPVQYRSEELTSRDKYNVLFKGVVCKFESASSSSSSYTLNHLIDESMSAEQWTEPEWGFPKGRRNPQEKDYDCALREFAEETGISTHHLHNIQNLIPYEEIFTGSNYKSYKHKYYVMFLDEAQHDISLANFEKSEVSLMEWKTLSQAVQCIRPYNLEKLRLLRNVDRTLNKFRVMKTKNVA